MRVSALATRQYIELSMQVCLTPKVNVNRRETSAALNDVPFYFPQPHQLRQRGTNENTNGLLREYFPKGTDLSKYSDEYIQSKVDELNKRPRKCLGYLTPYEVYYSTSLHLT